MQRDDTLNNTKQSGPQPASDDAIGQPSPTNGPDPWASMQYSGHARRQLWGVAVDDREYGYFDYYAGALTEPDAEAGESDEGTEDDEPVATKSPTSRERIVQGRRRHYMEMLFQALALRVRTENASRMQKAIEDCLVAVTGVASGPPLAVLSEGAATTPLRPIGDFKEIMDRLDALAAQQVEATDALDKYLAIDSELRKVVLSDFIAGERDRLREERSLLVEELDGSIHYALHTLLSDQEMLRQEMRLTGDETPSGVFRKLERAITTISRPGVGKRLEELSAKIAVVTDRQKLLIERRDAMNAELSRIETLLKELGFAGETTVTGMHARAAAREMRAEGPQSVLQRGAAESDRLFRELSALLESRIAPTVTFLNDAAVSQRPEEILDTLSSFLPIAGARLSPDQTRRLSRGMARFFASVQSVVASLGEFVSTRTLSDRAPASLSSDPELLIVESAERGDSGPVDPRAVHDDLARWFEAADARIREQPQEPMEAFAEFLQSSAPVYLRSPLAAEIEDLKGTLRLNR